MQPARPLVAVLGGGQLGRMLGEAAVPLGVACRFLDPSPDASAAAVGAVRVASLDDVPAAVAFGEDATVVTYEWEGVPASTARAVAERVPVRPGPRAVEIAQDRVTEKSMFADLGVLVPRFAPVEDHAGLDEAATRLGLPAVLKTRWAGYDGKGQRVVHAAADVEDAWTSLGGGPMILEELVAFDRELSILAARGVDGATVAYPLVETRHRGGVLRVAVAPAPLRTDRLQREAERIAARVLDQLDYVGVLAVELFQRGDELLANELAPRVHNSGHWSIEGAVTSQFENHLRAILGWPLGSAAARGHSACVNCLGQLPDPRQVLAVEGAHLHDYRKGPKAGRKVGHVTVTAESARARDERVEVVGAIVDAA
jgi:5-(carboxyamino)imidazole ribonucleotide synthase